MSVSNYSRFLSECIVPAPDRHSGVLAEEVYGVYVSWCLLNREKLGTESALGAAMEHEGHVKQGGVRDRYPGLAVTGAAAVDYILASQPSLI
ncbi:hypothetical protein QF038_003166 [Pseudarthrobacter sp. W1I19]|uniref:hypothetical protein n=1 Tax=Pseudarthrobacter sp. W1I19 TaxID=3042288 RepID=UPI00278476E1|nr:hypothetical protein [Pseudarthrobacter sp. W1I19]MDQ0924658.1 hypothetical protein [Pseudarthrobacter sp. W1I19]